MPAKPTHRKVRDEWCVRSGGESVVVDLQGNVYVANGQIFVYAKDGRQIAEIDVPERPLQLIFGGADRRTLFILAKEERRADPIPSFRSN